MRISGGYLQDVFRFSATCGAGGSALITLRAALYARASRVDIGAVAHLASRMAR